jgi:broad specificity phosphatase PhoE
MDDMINNMAEGSAIAVVMHGGAMNTCVRAWLGIEERGWRTFAFDNASVNLVQLQAKVPPTFNEDDEREMFQMLGFQNTEGVEYNYRMLLLNDVSHLAGLMGAKPAWFSAQRSGH